MTEIATPPAHRVGAAITAARTSLAAVASERPWSMTAAQTEEALDDIAALEAQTAEAKARLLTHAAMRGLLGEVGARPSRSELAGPDQTVLTEARRPMKWGASAYRGWSAAASILRGRRGRRAHGMTDDTDELMGPDLVLLLLRAPGTDSNQRDRVNGITRLEKLLFLADQESPLPGKVQEALVFRPYNFGPYSKQIYEAVDILEDADLVVEEKALNGRPLDSMEEASIDPDVEGVERRFYLTQDGREVADYLAKQHPQYFDLLNDVKARYGGLSLRKLIQYVYRRYPEFAEESLIRDQVL